MARLRMSKLPTAVWKLPREIHRIFKLVTSGNYQFLRFSPPGHFYSPIPDIGEVRSHAASIFDKSHKTIPGIDLNEQGQLELAQKFSQFHPDINFSENGIHSGRYYYQNEYFSYGDAVSLYSMMRYFKPKKIVEVGSGFSSAAMLDVNENFLDRRIQFTFIEPYASRLHSLITEFDRERCQIIETPVQMVEPGIFRTLEENDILFVDSSHVGKTHSDVLYILFNALPLLNKGVIIHFHDIFWPFEYPREWVEEGKAFNEAYFLRTFLQYNHEFEMLFFNSFLEHHHEEFLRSNLPQMVRTPPSEEVAPSNTSLWLRKTS